MRTTTMMPDAAVSAAIAQIAASIETGSAPRRRFPEWRPAELPWTQICQHERSGDQLEQQVSRVGNVGEGREDPRPAHRERSP